MDIWQLQKTTLILMEEVLWKGNVIKSDSKKTVLGKDSMRSILETAD